VIAPTYDMAFDFSEGLATVSKDGRTYIIDKQAHEIKTHYIND